MSYIGWIDDGHIYTAKGSHVGRVEGEYLYDKEGESVGRIEGGSIFADGEFTGCWVEDEEIFGPAENFPLDMD